MARCPLRRLNAVRRERSILAIHLKRSRALNSIQNKADILNGPSFYWLSQVCSTPVALLKVNRSCGATATSRTDLRSI